MLTYHIAPLHLTGRLCLYMWSCQHLAETESCLQPSRTGAMMMLLLALQTFEHREVPIKHKKYARKYVKAIYNI